MHASGHAAPAYIQRYIIPNSSKLPAALAVPASSDSEFNPRVGEAPKINDVAAADLRPNVSEVCERPRTVTSRPVVTARGRVIVSANELASSWIEVKQNLTPVMTQGT